MWTSGYRVKLTTRKRPACRGDYGLTDWVRAVADRLAGEGFIAIAPDLLSGKGPGGGGTERFASRDDVVKAVRGVSAPEVVTMLVSYFIF
jgi:dienelactone hydrolase